MVLTLVSISIILGVFLITQVYKNSDLEKRLKRLEGDFEPPVNVIVGKIPENISLSDVDPKHTLIRDVLESARLEDWKAEVEQDHRLSGSFAYMLGFNNPSNTVEIKVRFYLDEETRGKGGIYKPSIGFLIIKTTESVVSYDKDENKGSDIENEICLFLWENVIKYHNNINDQLKRDYENSIKNIKSKLTTLNRDRKLKNII